MNLDRTELDFLQARMFYTKIIQAKIFYTKIVQSTHKGEDIMYRALPH